MLVSGREAGCFVSYREREIVSLVGIGTTSGPTRRNHMVAAIVFALCLRLHARLGGIRVRRVDLGHGHRRDEQAPIEEAFVLRVGP